MSQNLPCRSFLAMSSKIQLSIDKVALNGTLPFIIFICGIKIYAGHLLRWINMKCYSFTLFQVFANWSYYKDI